MQPIYEQIVEQIKTAIMKNTLKQKIKEFSIRCGELYEKLHFRNGL